MATREFLDKWQEKIISRRFLAWVTAVVMLSIGKLESEHWAFITIVFIGGEVLEKYKDVIMNYFKK